MSSDAEEPLGPLRGWALVAAIVLAFLVLPGAVVFLPTARAGISALGLTLRDAYLVVPLVPALGLGVVAVWSALRARRDRQ
jgi:ABC-type glycerol-3-phosphate transport system permease component